MVLVSLLGGCANKEEKMKELLIRYGNETLEQRYRESKYQTSDRTFSSFKPTVLRVKIYEDETEKGSDGVTLHFVRAKLDYLMVDNQGDTKMNHSFFRYMALTVEEDGFGEMKVRMNKSREILALGADEAMMKGFYGEEMKAGEKLLSSK